jgi:hypothetical protein
VPWLRRLAAGLPGRRPEFDPWSVHVGFLVDKVALGQGFPENFGLPLSISFHRCSITRKTTMMMMMMMMMMMTTTTTTTTMIIIIRLHKKA